VFTIKITFLFSLKYARHNIIIRNTPAAGTHLCVNFLL